MRLACYEQGGRFRLDEECSLGGLLHVVSEKLE